MRSNTINAVLLVINDQGDSDEASSEKVGL